MTSESRTFAAAKRREEWMAARAAYFSTSQEMDDLCAQIQTHTYGMVSPDGMAALAQLSKKQRWCFTRYQQALEAYTASVMGTPSPGRLAAMGFNGDSFGSRPNPHITEREMEVLRLLSDGKTTKQIAHELKIAFKTSMTHRTHLLQKFDANNVALLIRKAIRYGFIEA